MTNIIRVGSTVRLKRKVAGKGPRQWTTVRSFIPGVTGGVWLEEALDRSRGWNVQDLEVKVPTRKAT